MATVPFLNPGNSVAPNGLPGPEISSAVTGGIAARQEQDTGVKLQAVVENYTMLQNQVRVNDAMNHARQSALDLTYNKEYGYQAQRGADALNRASGQPLPVEYGQKLNDSIDTIADGLTPEQQRVFRMQSAELQTNFVGSVQQHMLHQSQEYALSVQNSTLKLAGDQAGQYWNQPEKINGEGGLVQQAQAAAYATGKLTGMDTQAGILQAGSAIHRSVIQSALENGNPIYAQQYADKYKSAMTTDDILRVQGAITQQANAQIAQGAVAHAVTKIQPAVAPSDLDRLNGIVAGMESGNRETNADGSTVTSSAGAKGSMQVMDQTGTDPGFGIKPAAKLPDGSVDPADRARVGRDYLAAMVKRYGNIAQALAAYNAGPGSVDNAIAATKDDQPGLWLAALPKETQSYVTAGLQKYNQGGGAAQLPTREQFVQEAINILGPNATPQQLSLVRQSAEGRYKDILASRDEAGDNALRSVQQALVQNGGDYAALQQNQPQLISDLVKTAPGKVDDALAYAKHIAKGENVDNMAAYARAITYPNEMAAMKDGEFDQFIGTNFSAATGRQLTKMRADIINGSSDNSAQAINTEVVNRVLKERLNNIGIDASPKPTDVKASARVGAVYKFITDGLLKAQIQAGEKFAPQDTEKYIDDQFRKNAILPHFFGDGEKPILSMQYSDVPSANRKVIDGLLPKSSDNDKLRLYWLGQQGKK